MKQEIKELEKQIQTLKNMSMFQDFSKEIAEAEAKIEELKQHKDINIVILETETVETEEIEETKADTIDYDMILCSHQELIKGTTGKQYNSYSYGVNMGRVDNERVNGEMNKFL